MPDRHSPQHPAPARPEPAREPKRRRTLIQSGGSRPVLGFLLRFALCWAVALGLATFSPRIEQWAIGATMWSLATVLRPFAGAAIVSGSLLQVWGASVQIVSDCTPLMPTAALWAAVIAFPATWGWRLTGLVAGAAVIWIYNLARILALVPVIVHKPGWFEFIHVYLWQTVTLIVVFMCFLAWLRFQPTASTKT